MDKVAVWQTVKFDLVFVGDNMRGTPDWIAARGRDRRRFGAKVIYLPYTRTALGPDRSATTTTRCWR